MFKIFIFLTILVQIFNLALAYDDRIVEIQGWGKARGTQSTTVKGRTYVQWQGIPYGKAPTGSGRFKPSELETSVQSGIFGYFEANQTPKPCIQPPPSIAPRQSEDCLGLSIFRPKMNEGELEQRGLLPVILYVHGGAFAWGYGAMYPPGRLLDRDVLMVNFNYRMGILGAFSLQTNDAPGNLGIYDAALAIKWVKTYISNFGGDPNKITLAGQSAGAAIVSHLLVSPQLPEGMIQRAIISSGNAINKWPYIENPIPAALDVASRLGCNLKGQNAAESDYTQILNCIYSVPAKDFNQVLIDWQKFERAKGNLGFDAVNPSIQPPHISNRIIPEVPSEVYKRGGQRNIPVMVGANRHDGSFVLSILYNNFLVPNNYQNNPTFLKELLVPTILSLLGVQDDTGAIYDSLAMTYLGDARFSGNFTEMIPGLTDLCSVYFFKSGALKTAEYYAQIQPSTYLYSFDYYGTTTMYSVIGGSSEIPGGIAHGDDLLYVFPLTHFLNNPGDVMVADQMINYWANFATTGDPNDSGSGLKSDTLSNWPSFSENESFLKYNKSLEILRDYSETWPRVSYEIIDVEYRNSLSPAHNEEFGNLAENKPNQNSAPSFFINFGIFIFSFFTLFC